MRFANNLTGWKAVVAAIVIVSLVGLRVVTKMNRWRDDGADKAVPQTASPLERGDDFTIKGIATIPTAKGFTWKLQEDSEKDGESFLSYLGLSDDGFSAATILILQNTINDDAVRADKLTRFRQLLLDQGRAQKLGNLTGTAPSLDPPIPDHVQFSLSAGQPDGKLVTIHADVFFRNNAYLYSAVSSSEQHVNFLRKLGRGITEVKRAGQTDPGPDSVAEADPSKSLGTGLPDGKPQPSTKPPSSTAGTMSKGSSVPATTPDAPLQLAAEEMKLPAPVFDTAAGAAGRVLVVHLSGVDEAAVVDLVARKITGTVPAPQDALIAAGMERLVVITPSDKGITRYSLATTQVEKTGKLDIDGQVLAIAMGHSSDGPVFVQWASSDKPSASYGLLDLESFNMRVVAPGDGKIETGQVRLRNNAKRGIQLRASADSRVFTLRPSSGSSNMERLFVGRSPVAHSDNTGSGGHVIPSADGRIFCTGRGYFSGSFAPRAGTDRSPCFVTSDPRYFLSMSAEGLSIRDVVSGKTIQSLAACEELGDDFLRDCRFGSKKEPYQLMPDQRIHCVPDQNLLVTIPAGEDRLLIRGVPFDTFPNPSSLLESGVIIVPGIIYNAIPAGDGRLLVLHLRELGKAVVVHLVQSKIVGEIPVPDDALIAAGREKLLVINNLDGQISRWSLATFQEEMTVPLECDGIPRVLAMGHASTGPALLQWTTEKGGVYSLVDVDSLELTRISNLPFKKPADGEIYVNLTSTKSGGVALRAAADSQSFGLWKTWGTPSGVQLITLGGAPTAQYKHSSHGHVIPTPGGRVLTAQGSFSMDLVFNEDRSLALFPTADERYMIALTREAGQLCQVSTGEKVADLPPLDELGEDFLRNCGSARKTPYQLRTDRRVYCLPTENLVAIIPPTDDRILIKEVPFDVPPRPDSSPADIAKEPAETVPPPTAPPKDPPAGSSRRRPMKLAGDSAKPTKSKEDSSPARELRLWQDTSGKFSIKAEYVSYGMGMVKLKKEDGSQITVPLEKLSEEDQKWIQDRLRR